MNLILTAYLLHGTFTDLRDREISLSASAFFAALGILISIAGGRSAAELGAALLPGGVLLFLSVLSGGDIGSGDGIAAGVMGCYAGAETVLASCAWGSLIAAAAALVLAAGGCGRRTELPYVPCLTGGYFLLQILRA